MNAVIENGGLDCSLYNTTRAQEERDSTYETRNANMKHLLLMDLLFFNQILDVINMSTDAEELNEKMKLLFVHRTKRNLHKDITRVFSYDFLIDNGDVDSEPTGMQVWQVDNPNRIIYVKF